MRHMAGTASPQRRAVKADTGGRLWPPAGQWMARLEAVIEIERPMRASNESSNIETAGAGSVAPGTRDLSSAMRRLVRALDHLESAVDTRLEHQAGLGDTEAEVQRMGVDRTRLAESLDKAEARAQKLESTNREVANRLVNAMETIRNVLEGPPEREA